MAFFASLGARDWFLGRVYVLVFWVVIWWGIDLSAIPTKGSGSLGWFMRAGKFNAVKNTGSLLHSINDIPISWS